MLALELDLATALGMRGNHAWVGLSATTPANLYVDKFEFKSTLLFSLPECLLCKLSVANFDILFAEFVLAKLTPSSASLDLAAARPQVTTRLWRAPRAVQACRWMRPARSSPKQAPTCCSPTRPSRRILPIWLVLAFANVCDLLTVATPPPSSFPSLFSSRCAGFNRRGVLRLRRLSLANRPRCQLHLSNHNQLQLPHLPLPQRKLSPCNCSSKRSSSVPILPRICLFSAATGTRQRSVASNSARNRNHALSLLLLLGAESAA